MLNNLSNFTDEPDIGLPGTISSTHPVREVLSAKLLSTSDNKVKPGDIVYITNSVSETGLKVVDKISALQISGTGNNRRLNAEFDYAIVLDGRNQYDGAPNYDTTADLVMEYDKNTQVFPILLEGYVCVNTEEDFVNTDRNTRPFVRYVEGSGTLEVYGAFSKTGDNNNRFQPETVKVMTPSKNNLAIIKIDKRVVNYA